MIAPPCIAIDWGSSTFRAFLLDGDFTVQDSVCAESDIFAADGPPKDEVFRRYCGAWVERHPGIEVLMSGMVGSRSGWVETGYVDCPAGRRRLAESVITVESRIDARLRIVPGVRGPSPSGAPDVMRGEEVQVFGALALLGLEEGMFCLPGTHSKWVEVRRGEIRRFATFMTGELFALTAAGGALGTLGARGELDPESFRAGLRHSRAPGGLAHQLFSLRARSLTGDPGVSSLRACLSGIFVGNELAGAKALFPDTQRAIVVAGPVLAPNYELALSSAGLRPVLVSAEEAFLAGIVGILNGGDRAVRRYG